MLSGLAMKQLVLAVLFPALLFAHTCREMELKFEICINEGQLYCNYAVTYRSRGQYRIILTPKLQLRVNIEINHEAKLSGLWPVMPDAELRYVTGL